jgi:hypothetical protein
VALAESDAPMTPLTSTIRTSARERLRAWDDAVLIFRLATEWGQGKYLLGVYHSLYLHVMRECRRAGFSNPAKVAQGGPL